jgi:hypothetical protein
MNKIRTFASENEAIIAGYALASTRIVTVRVGKIINNNEAFTTVIFNEVLTGKQIAISLNHNQANHLPDTFKHGVLYQISISENTDKTVYAVYENVNGVNELKEYRTVARPCIKFNSIVNKDDRLVQEAVLSDMRDLSLRESTSKDLFNKSFDDLTIEEKRDITKLLFGNNKFKLFNEQEDFVNAKELEQNNPESAEIKAIDNQKLF